MDSLQETQRRLSNLIRIGIVAEVDFGAALCRVSTGDNQTDWLPWLTYRAGGTIDWSAPGVGEQVVVLCAEGELRGGVVLRGLYSDEHPAPTAAEGVHLTRYGDGAEVQYDENTHALTATLPSGGTAKITADGGVTIEGDLVVTGDVSVAKTLTAETDVIGGGKSLKSHLHAGVQSGNSQSGPPA